MEVSNVELMDGSREFDMNAFLILAILCIYHRNLPTVSLYQDYSNVGRKHNQLLDHGSLSLHRTRLIAASMDLYIDMDQPNHCLGIVWSAHEVCRSLFRSASEKE